MKFGIRKPSLKKSLKARTTGKMKRKMKSAVNPLYGKKGMGYVRNPKKAVYNKVYNKTTVGVNPLSGVSRSKKASSPRLSSEDLAYTRYETVEKEVPVTNPIERFFRRLQTGRPVKTKTVQQKVLVEKYTYGEVTEIQSQGQQHLAQYNESIRLVKETENPETFFPRLESAESSLEEAVGLVDRYAFLSVEGDDLKKALANFKQEKAVLVKEFVDRHYAACVESAEQLKTDRGKTNRYIRNYHDLSPYFSQLPESAVGYIKQIWSQKVALEELV